MKSGVIGAVRPLTIVLVYGNDDAVKKTEWQLFLVPAVDRKIVKCDMDHGTDKHPYLWRNAVYICCFAILRMRYCFYYVLEVRMFARLLLVRKLRNAIYGSVLHTDVCTEDALKVLRAASKNGSIIREEVLSIRTTYGSVDQISWHIN